MKDHKKKMIAPIIITVLFMVYLLVYAIIVIAAAKYTPATILLALPLIALGFGMIYTLYTRIKEIRSGEEDDLSNY